MHLLADGYVSTLIATYGYAAVGVIVGLESMAIPVPGETVLITAALIAGTTHDLNVWLVVGVATVGAIVGDNVGFWIGREFGLRLLLRYGGYLGITGPRIKLGQYLVSRYGGAVVFFGRFAAILRAAAAFLAGVNSMSWPRFLIANAAGAVVWACLYGFGAYYLGKQASKLAGPAAVGVSIIALFLVIGIFMLIHRHEAQLILAAERALPGPVRWPKASRQ